MVWCSMVRNNVVEYSSDCGIVYCMRVLSAENIHDVKVKALINF